MPEYAKMKNADLEALLKERSLPSGGKKADMVDRLTKDDEKAGAAGAPAEPKPAVNAEDEIDWDDEGDEAAAEPAKAEPAATEPAPATEPATDSAAAEPQSAAAEESSVQPTAEGAEVAIEEKKEPAPDYTRGLSATNIDEEIEKRKKRALKFGKNPEDDEGLKKLERMKKFGETGQVQGLDEALPERQRKREREDKEDGGDNKRRNGGRTGGRGGRGGRRDNRDERGDRNVRDSRSPRRERAPRPAAVAYSDKDKAAVEARKARFAKPSA
jgi:SAP domain-containing ribonucleoprotein